MNKYLFIALTCLALTACQDVRFVLSDQVPAQPSYSRIHHFTMWGKKSTIEPVKVCGSINNVAMVEEKEYKGHSWLRFLTCGIYSPVRVNVYCKVPMNSPYRARQPH